MEKKNTGLIFFVIILSLLVMALSGYIVYDKFLNKDNDFENEINDNDNQLKEEDTNTYNNNDKEWVNYLKNKDIIIRKSVWNYELDTCQFEAISISNDAVNNIIDELSTKKITKYFYLNPPVGTICTDRFKIEYDNNVISLEANGYLWIDDEILSNKLDFGVDNFKYDDNYSSNDFVYIFQTNYLDIFNKYIK